MTHKELKAMARWGVAKWCDIYLPHDGDYGDPQVIMARSPGNGRTPDDGDYVMTMVFHNKKNAKEQWENADAPDS